MIQNLNISQTKIEKVGSGDGTNGYFITESNTPEILGLIADYDVEEEDILAAYDPDETGRIDSDEVRTLMILKFPIKTPDQSDVPYRTLPSALILTSTICLLSLKNDENKIHSELLNLPIKRHYAITDQPGKVLLFHLFYRYSVMFMDFLKRINATMKEIQQKVYYSLDNQHIVSLIRLEQSLIFFNVALNENLSILDKLSKNNTIKFTEEELGLIDDLKVEYTQALSMSKIFSDILGNLMDAFASIISNNVNVIMKRLTYVTISLMIPTLIVSFYGMNVQLPFQERPLIFILILSVSFVLSLTFTLFIRLKRW